MKPSPMREVVRLIRVKGARRGHLLACLLECGHWCTRRQKPGRFGVACAACSAVAELERQGLAVPTSLPAVVPR